MTRKQQNRLDMFNGVHGYMMANGALWQQIPAVVEAVDDLADDIEVINALSGKQSTNTTGVTADKEQARTAYEDLISEIADQIGAFAAKNENVALEAEVDFTRVDLDKLTDDALINTGNTVARLTGENLTNLAGYSITQDDIDELGALKTRFEDVKGAPRLAIVGRAGQTETLPEALNATTRLLNKRLDRLMSRFRRTHPEFFAGYEKSRVIVDRSATNSEASDQTQNPSTPA